MFLPICKDSRQNLTHIKEILKEMSACKYLFKVIYLLIDMRNAVRYAFKISRKLVHGCYFTVFNVYFLNFFSICVFFARTFTVHRTPGVEGGYLFSSFMTEVPIMQKTTDWFLYMTGTSVMKELTPLYHFQSLHRHLDISRAITTDSSPLHVASSPTRTGDV